MFSLCSLPDHLIRKIATFSMLTPFRVHCDIKPSTEDVVIPPQLLVLCQSWRNTCLPIGSKFLRERLRLEGYTNHYYSTSMSFETVVENNCQKYVKSVAISVGFGDILNGIVLYLLSLPPYTTIILPNVTWIQLNIEDIDMEDIPNAEMCRQNVSMFARCLRRIIPNATSCNIDGPWLQEHDTTNGYNNFGHLITELQAGATKFGYFNLSKCITIAELSANTNLTEISYLECINSELFIQLIRINSKSLETLYISFDSEDFISKLIESEPRAPMQYSRLRRLEAKGICDAYTQADIEISEAPFPNLRYLYLRNVRQFATNIFFSQNHLTIEHIDINVDVPDLVRLRRNNMLSPNQFPKAKYLDFKVFLDCPQDTLDYNTQFIGLLTNIAPNLGHFGFFHFSRHTTLLTKSVRIANQLHSLCNSPLSMSLESLALTGIRLKTMEIMKTISIFPKLRQFYTGWESDSSETTTKDSYMASSYARGEMKAIKAALATSQLRVIKINNEMSVDVYNGILFLLLELFKSCPNLAFAKLRCPNEANGEAMENAFDKMTPGPSNAGLCGSKRYLTILKT